MFWIWMPLVGVLVAVGDSISCFIVFVGCHLVSSRGESEILRGPIMLYLSRNRHCRLVWRLLLLLVGQHSTVFTFVSPMRSKWNTFSLSTIIQFGLQLLHLNNKSMLCSRLFHLCGRSGTPFSFRQ
jgi:hypothetical protein